MISTFIYRGGKSRFTVVSLQNTKPTFAHPYMVFNIFTYHEDIITLYFPIFIHT